MTVEEFLELGEGPPYCELYDGELVLNPPPTTGHQRIVVRLIVLLDAACPPELEVFAGPTGWMVDQHTVLEPDVLIVRRSDVGRRLVEAPPPLCVEVLSPSNRRNDLVRKRAIYERAGVGSYWIVDPGDSATGATGSGGRLTVLELNDAGRYELIADATGDTTVDLRRPFPITVVPARLAD